MISTSRFFFYFFNFKIKVYVNRKVWTEKLKENEIKRIKNNVAPDANREAVEAAVEATPEKIKRFLKL